LSDVKKQETITKDESFGGLSDSEVIERRKQYGFNVITQKNQLLVIKNLVSQFMTASFMHIYNIFFDLDMTYNMHAIFRRT